MTQIDSPQNIFAAGVNRGAAIVVGIAALALVSDVFAAPNVHPGLIGKLTAAHQRVRAFALAVLRGESAHPIHSANLLREITALHPDITALVAESSDGGARGWAARSAAVALVAEVSAAGALSSLPVETSPSLRRELGGALADPLGEESRALQLRLQRRGCRLRRPARRAFCPTRPGFVDRGPAGARRHRRPAGGSPLSTPYPCADLPLAPSGCAKRPACVSGGADLLHPFFPGWLAARVAGRRPGWGRRSLERQQPEPAGLHDRRRHRDCDRRAACGRDGVLDSRRGRPVSPSGDRHGAESSSPPPCCSRSPTRDWPRSGS